MSVLELEKLVESLSEAEKSRLRELLGTAPIQNDASAKDGADISWLDELQATARAICEREGTSSMPTDLAATFRQRKRASVLGRSEISQ